MRSAHKKPQGLSAAGVARLQGPRRRVWWAPTDDKARSDFGGMFWTATVMKKTASGFKVVYDNGARMQK